MHQKLLTALQGIAKVSLISLLRDDRIGMPSEKDMHLFFPDLHLVTDARRAAAGYKYLPDEPLLVRVLQTLRNFKVGLAGERLTLYQLGDLLDVWRETPVTNPKRNTASAIEDDHIAALALLYDEDADFRFLFGNHDFDLYRWKNYDAWRRNIHLTPKKNAAPTVSVLHGDIFDWIETVPGALKQFLVYYLAPLKKPSRRDLDQISTKTKATVPEQTTQNPAAIQAASPMPLGATQDLGPAPVPGESWNIQPHDFLPAARRFSLQANQSYGFKLRVMVIGHTHHARIAVNEGDDFFALVDCGAWVDDHTTAGDPTPRRNSQIGVLCGNEVRVYQLAGLP
jgi:UDP-2,3-diacylglucosamine pyrophosphatase LpxH